ncbi:hypothetical protein RAC89_19195 [Paenibacillus sp. GD4]|uniref:hypothetical protein n=1 Tax=Paenibacillus sp. GD4 TaxID=3068890 RepID=UPI00279678EA|nr:hypothetical protein [Paenibacillus sp. GD4]MDQ1912523.1 hypothetical protein [Paenibacillus sp. GD4]
MKFKQYDEEKIGLIGQDAVTLLIHQLLQRHIAEEFAHGVARLDHQESIKDEIQFERDYEQEKDFEYILFHLVMFGASIMKYNATSYVMKRKFFGGYTEDVYKAFTFAKGIEKGLSDFRMKGKLPSIRQVKAEGQDSKPTYSNGDSLNKTMPYFFFEHTRESLDEISLSFARNLAYLRRPKNPRIVIGVFNEKAKEIVPLAHEIMSHFFVE